MTVHICRDLILGKGGAATGSYDSLWAISVFLQGVLGYTVQSSGGTLVPPTYSDLTIPYYSWNGSTFTQISSSIISFNSASCFVTASGPHVLVQFSTDVVNLLAAAYPTNWPSGSGAWPPGANGNPFTSRSWLALKSNNFPLANSGIFAIANSTLWLTGNYIEIDYRATSGSVQVETGSLLHASLWQPPPGSDNYSLARTGTTWGTFNAQANNGGAATSYKTQGSATLTRMILTSPSPLAWQVRLCLESDADRTFQGQTNQAPRLTCIPGFSGSGGDFPVGVTNNPNSPSYHLHLPQWFNSTAAQYGNCIPGLDVLNIGNVGVGGGYGVTYRFYAWGDDTTGTCGIFLRNYRNSTDAFCMWGQAENETIPLPALPVQRLFFIGQGAPNPSQYGPAIDWRSGPYNTDAIGGMAYSLDRRLGQVTCVLSSYAFVAAQTSNMNSSNGFPTPNDSFGSIRFQQSGPTTPFLPGGGVELLPCELVAGTWDNMWNPSSFQDILPMEPRIMGRVPLGARFGNNTGMSNWSAADTGLQWFHLVNGFFMPWGGVAGQ